MEEDEVFEESNTLTPLRGDKKPAPLSSGSVYHSAQEVNTEITPNNEENNLPPDFQTATSVSEESAKPQGKSHHTFPHQSLPTFYDGERTVDFVLVWDQLNPRSGTEQAVKRRRVFEENLAREGLELEYEKPEPNGLTFIKIHAPVEVLRRYSEILKLRMPMKEELCPIERGVKLNPLLHATMYISQKIPGLQDVHAKTNSLLDEVNSWFHRVMSRFYVDTKVFPPKSQRFTAVYSRDKEYLFDIQAEGFFTPAIHSRIVQFILDRKRFSEDEQDDFAFGIERLINEYVYSAAYPLHDGDLRQPGSWRYTLFTEWAAVRKSFRYQPLDYIKDYFGVKIGLYFAWLGFYTHMLIPASVVGVLCFIYSCITLYDNQPSEDICNKHQNIKMCPLCDYFCDYWNLEETCLHARVTYLFDNPSTVFFAIFMSFWEIEFKATTHGSGQFWIILIFPDHQRSNISMVWWEQICNIVTHPTLL